MTEHLFVPLDGSRVAETALPHAAALAQLLGARVTLARVPESMVVPAASGGVWATKIVESGEARERAVAELSAVAARDIFEGIAVDWVAPDYPVAQGLLQAIDECGADLVVMTSHGRSAAGRWVFGSVAQKLLRGASAPVYVVRAPEEAFVDPDGFAIPAAPSFKVVVVPLDGSDHAEKALDPASELVQASGGELRLVTVPTVPGYLKIVPETAGAIPEALLERAAKAENYLEELISGLAQRGIRVEGDVEVLFAGAVTDGILEYAESRNAELIVMTTHGRGGVGRWLLGSVAEKLLGASPMPVLVVRAKARG